MAEHYPRRLAATDPIEAGKQYLFRYRFPGYVWLKAKDFEIAAYLEEQLPIEVKEITRSVILSDLNWLNVWFLVKRTFQGGEEPSLLQDDVRTWGKLIGDSITEVGHPGGIGGMTFAEAWEVTGESDASEIIGGKDSPLIDALKWAGVAAAGLAGMYLLGPWGLAGGSLVGLLALRPSPVEDILGGVAEGGKAAIIGVTALGAFLAWNRKNGKRD